ncbi:peptidase inhibitor family I36 protein [Streptomyces sp. NPDC014685]|uniref:peptidase inhibitor family I36 protein n=1 Tax=Streptomyces sp. NPDC014685 TaxID=3364881 RepID=UPI0036F4F7FE
MTARRTMSARLARVAVVATTVVGSLLPLGAGVAHAAPGSGIALPPGVVALNDGEPCPPATLCLYRDYNNRGPAYGIGAGYDVDLRDLPMQGGVHGPTAANEVSSWVNNTHDLATLADLEGHQLRPLFPGQSLQEPATENDTVDFVHWVR